MTLLLLLGFKNMLGHQVHERTLLLETNLLRVIHIDFLILNFLMS